MISYSRVLADGRSSVKCEFNVFSGDTLSFIGDQTSYMSICVGEGHDDSLSLLSAQELRQKVNYMFMSKHCLCTDYNSALGCV